MHFDTMNTAALETTLLATSRPRLGEPFAPHLHVVAWLAIAGLALGYAWALRHLGRRSGAAPLPTRRQLRSLTGAVVALVLALTWPLADLAAHWSLTALVVQRLLLTLAAAPLLLLAMPGPVLAALTRPASVDACLDVLTRPVVAVATFTVVAVGTLLTPAVAAQASSPWWRGLTDVVLVLAGAVLWGPVLRHIPGTHRTSPVAVTAYLFIQSVIPTFPAIIYVFSRHPLYDAFRHVHVAFPVSTLVDQQLAGVVAKVATLPVLWSAAWVSLMRAQRVEDAAADGDDSGEPLTWAEVERQLERVARSERKVQAREARLRHAWAGPRPITLPWAEPRYDDAGQPGGESDASEHPGPPDGPPSPEH